MIYVYSFANFYSNEMIDTQSKVLIEFKLCFINVMKQECCAICKVETNGTAICSICRINNKNVIIVFEKRYRIIECR